METQLNRLSRRQFLLGSAAVAAAAALGACTPKQAQETSEVQETPGGFTDETIVLRFHGRLGSQGDHFDYFIKKFNDDHFPRVYAKSEHFPGADYFQKINTMIAGGTVGDSFWISAIEGFYRFCATGVYTPLDDIVEAMGYDLKQHEDNAEMGRYQGKLYTLPWNTQPGRSGLYYNRKMFADAGVPEPDETWTYDTLREAAKELTNPDAGVYGIMWNDAWYWGGLMQIRAFGGDFLDEKCEKCTVNSDETIAALRMMGETMFADKSAIRGDQIEGGGWVGRAQMFAANRLAMFQDGFWGKYIKDYVEPERWYTHRMPLGPAKVRGNMYEFCSVGVSKISKHPQEAFELTTYFCSKEAGDHLAFVANSVPGGRPDVFDDPKNYEGDDPVHEHFREFKNSMREILPLYLPWNFRETEYAKVITEALSLYFLGDAPLEEAVERAYQDGTAVLAKDSLAGDNNIRFEAYVPIWIRNRA
jgi:multiple sugar transport system substrate-binding protein